MCSAKKLPSVNCKVVNFHANGPSSSEIDNVGILYQLTLVNNSVEFSNFDINVY